MERREHRERVTESKPDSLFLSQRRFFMRNGGCGLSTGRGEISTVHRARGPHETQAIRAFQPAPAKPSHTP